MAYILVTGANGMIGNRVVGGLLNAGHSVLGLDSTEPKIEHKKYQHIQIDLVNCLDVEDIFDKNEISHVIHLAAIAHKIGQSDLSWAKYYRINTLCAETIFECAVAKNIPIFFASTADVYGITEGNVTLETKRRPIGEYAKSKFAAENVLVKICKSGNNPYVIARFAPVYFGDSDIDKKKRYYLKHPKYCYRIGKGLSYEFLNVTKIVDTVLYWVDSSDKQIKINLYDKAPVNTRDIIAGEKENGRANYVIIIPMWIAKWLRFAVHAIFGKESYKAYMMAKLINPIRFEREYDEL